PGAMTASSTAAPGAELEKVVEVKLSGAWDRACAGEWLPVTFDLYRPATEQQPVWLHKVATADHEIRLNTDLLQPGVEIRPGERYRFTVGVCVVRAKMVDLGALGLVLGRVNESGNEVLDTIPASSQGLQVRPAIGSEIAVRVEALCRYDEGTKVLLTLKHQGGTRFTDLTVSLGPAEAIRAGKPAVCRPVFAPGDEEQLELVVDQTELDLSLGASVDGQRPEARRRLGVEPPAPAGGTRFRFLEPRRLARDRQRVFEILGDSRLRAVPQPGGVYVLESGCQYRVEVVPMQPGVQAVRLNDSPGLFHVRKSERVAQQGAWHFTLDVTAPHLLRRPERLFYEMDTPEGKLTGEIPVSLKQSSWG